MEVFLILCVGAHMSICILYCAFELKQPEFGGIYFSGTNKIGVSEQWENIVVELNLRVEFCSYKGTALCK